ncbi:AAA family ATPase [Lachnospiraceae bacterium 48-21]
MGIYLNPGNIGFEQICRGEYIDKTGLIRLVNQRIGGPNNLLCISRPRRFGKSYAAKMLCAYYDCSCDSHHLFAKRNIGKAKSYRTYLNQYNVIYLDITGFISAAKRQGIPLRDVPNMIVGTIHEELMLQAPELPWQKSLTDCLVRYVEKPEGKSFIFIIDEWDANGSQSAISDFQEYSILNPDQFAEFTGFTEREVRKLCKKNKMDFEKVKAWYDGYDFHEVGSIYNPFSVVRAMEAAECRSFWRESSAAESLKTYINMDFDGMQEMVSRLITGEEIEVDTWSFQNDFQTFRSRDDILTLLTHLGYLTYRKSEHTVRIPNEEVRNEFRNILKGNDVNPKWMELIRRSRKLLDDTVAGNGDAVARAIEEIRKEQYAPVYYNNELALRAVIKFAYIVTFGQYVKIEELPSGKGSADVVFIPKRLTKLPAMVVELKWNKTSGGAIRQIKDKGYPEVLKDYGGEILLIGINYDERTKIHTCEIEKGLVR